MLNHRTLTYHMLTTPLPKWSGQDKVEISLVQQGMGAATTMVKLEAYGQDGMIVLGEVARDRDGDVMLDEVTHGKDGEAMPSEAAHGRDGETALAR